MLEVRPMAKPTRRPKTLYDWYVEHEQGGIDLTPSYGRGTPPWPWELKALIVNTVLRGWDMPKFYLADFTYGPSSLQEERKPYAVVDGRQRFGALFGFMREEFALDATPIWAPGSYSIGLPGRELSLPGATRRDLMMEHPDLAARFERHVPTVMSVISDSVEDVEELMRRLGHVWIPKGEGDLSRTTAAEDRRGTL